MPYYDTIDEDLAMAKALLDRGRAALVEQLDEHLLPDPELRQRLIALQGGTIYGGDTFAAYKLLESFVEYIESMKAKA